MQLAEWHDASNEATEHRMTPTPSARLLDDRTVDALSPGAALHRAARGAGVGALTGGLIGLRLGLPGLVIGTVAGAGLCWALGPLMAGAKLGRKD